MARLALTLTAAALIGVAGLGSRTDAASVPDNACRDSSVGLFRSCRLGASSDKLLGFVSCLNLADDMASNACHRQVVADARDAVKSCKDQRDARAAACGRLGPAPYDPVINPANYVATIDNPYFPLVPGTKFIYEGQTSAGLEHDEFFVTHNIKMILGVPCIEVHDTVQVSGELTEDTLDWFAQDTNGNVWYFGENSKQLAGGLIVGVEGSWTGGVDGAKPGIVMKAQPAVGDFYRQEWLPDTAEDLAEVLSLTASATVPAPGASCAGACLQTRETSGLEPDGLEHKFYTMGVGNVLTVDLVTMEQSALVQVLTNQ
jgi:hypothetical protein